MSEQLTLPAEARERAGKGASRELRRDGRVPAVIYGDKKEPLSVHVEEKLLTKMLSNGHFMNTVVMVDAGGKSHRTLPKDVQFHPVSSRPIHVDFLRIGEHSEVNVNVPVFFTDEEDAPGITRGGVLNIVRHDLELVCEASSIPGQIEISLAGLDIGDSIHISSVKLPKGSKSAIDDRDFTIATIVAPSAMKSEEGDTETEAGDVPVVGEEGEGEEGEAPEAKGGEEG
ncbi:MAG: 50S ribosomal protein L25/general stress protein Ctc [Sphingomonas sp.]|uniref:50S ribosomal protein L25/general stress protein Ctc n=1 Tax=Sphingomonas sp. TaxID=28214 RepID=UPI00179CEA44|nr:50S ribosomal protein L25/general stress protein Ctc [Sphingomonas sp.]MBA3666508.1 50S ribosomal protein L25/general stress protein Ctc [Sphingomonas sp.]